MTRTATAPRRVRRVLAWAALAIGLAMLLPPALVVLGITLDAAPWRAEVARAIGQALQREVRFDGPARITLSLQPELHVGGIHVANPPGFSEPDLATLGEARFRVELLPLLRRRLSIGEFSARDVRLRLEVLADGRSNWRFGDGRGAPVEPSAGRGLQAGPALGREDVAGLAIGKLVLERIAVEFVRSGGTPHFFNLDRLEAKAPEGQALQLQLTGRVERSFPYRVDIEGGALSALLAARDPWPLKLTLAFAGTELGLEGSVLGARGDERADFAFSLRTDDLSQLERLLQVSLPPVGATRIGTRVQWRPGLLRLEDIAGRMGDTSLEGELSLSTEGPVPRLTGALTVPSLDLRPFRGQAPAVQEAPKSLLDTYRDLQSETFDLKRLADLDADLRLEVGTWLSLPGDVRDASMSIRLAGGVLHTPMKLRVAGVPLEGRLDVDASAATPTFGLALSTRAAPLAGLARFLAGIEGIEGIAERFDLGLSASGGTLGELTRSVSAKLALDRGRLSYGNAEGGRPVEFRLDRFEVALPAGAALEGRARGALLGEPFTAAFTGGDLPTLARGGRWPATLRATGSGARLEVSGELPAASGAPATDLRFAFDAPRAGSVARWLGLAPDAQAPVSIGGRLSARPDALWLRDFTLALGRTRLTGELGRTELAGSSPQVQVRLDVAEADVAQLQTLLPPPRPDAATRDLRTTLELPILPRGIDLGDADVALHLRRLRLPETEITDVRFEGRVREGRLSDAPFGATVAGTPFGGLASVDLRGQVPEVVLELAAARVDVGEMLRRLKVAEGVDARVDTMQLSLVLRGNRLGELLARSGLEARLRGGQWTLRDPAGKPLVAVAIGEGTIAAPAGEPLRLAVDGTIDAIPVAIRMGSGRLADLAQPGARVPLSLSAEAAGARLELEGSARVPLTQRDGDLVLRVSGDRLDTLNRLARTELPPWGPWSLGGRFEMTARGYQMPALALRVGASRLDGRGAIDFGGERPRASLALRAPGIQLDDFRFGDWSPLAGRPAAPKTAQGAATAQSVEQLREKARGAAQEGHRLLSRTTLLKQDAELDVEVDEVRSGADRLGGGRLRARLQAARIDVSEAEVRVPGGAARLSMQYEPLPGDREVRLRSRLRVDRFDYAVLARRVQPDTDLKGLFSAHLDLDATAPPERLMQHGNGRLDLAVWPVNLKSGVFDLWAVNLFVAVLPALDGSAGSKVNCAVARFDLRDGRMKENRLLVDTTRLRAGGTARVDFHDESVAVRLQPTAKVPQFFSLATPVEVSGHLTDFRVGLPKGSVIGTIGRFFGSIVTTPYAMLTTTPLPADGEDVCAGAMRAAD